MGFIARSTVTGLVFAGGRATRMGGVNKALVPFRGRPLISHVVGRLKPQVRTLLLSANRDAAVLSALADGAHVVADRTDVRPGPLAALEAAAGLIRTEWVLTAPCDAPLLPEDLMACFARAQAKVLDEGRDPDAFVACAGGYFQSAFACVRAERLSEAAVFLERGEHRLRRFHEALGCEPVTFSGEEAFTNFNTLEELHALDGGGPLPS